MTNLSGIIAAIPTPLLENEDVDVKGLCRVIDYMIEQGVSGIFVLGSMGEGVSLLDAQKRIVVERACEYINGKVPLLAGISDSSTRRTLEMGKTIQKLGADYLVTTTPYFYKYPAPESIIKYINSLAGALAKPLIFYNCPGFTDHRLDIQTIEKIMDIPNIVAIKDSSMDIHLITELLRRYPAAEERKCKIFQGDESMYDISLLLGVDGIVTGGGCVYLDILNNLYQAAKKGDRLSAFQLQKEFRMKMDEMLGPELAIDWMAAVKHRLKELGLCEANVTSPFLDRYPKL